MIASRPFLALPVSSVAVAAALLFSGFGGAVHAQVRTNAHPAARITAKIDNGVTVTLAGSHPSVVDGATIGARVNPATRLTHMQLVLTTSDDQEFALQGLLNEQQDKASSNYHQWLTPQAFGQFFGASSADLAQITGWLQDGGFSVDSISKSGRIVVFSGNVGQVEAAFHTQMNHLTVAGEEHLSNVTDLQIPAAFAGVVKGVASLNNFFPKSNVVNPHKATLFEDVPAATNTPYVTPLYTSTSSGAHYVTPGDAAIIYNSTPLLAAGVDGTGQTIAVIGRTDISLADVQQFRSMFGLKKNDPTFTVLGEDPGVTSDDIEAYLDVEWAGGMAPGANVNFIVAGSDYVTTSGINASALYAVDNNIGDIISMSYGGCESSDGVTQTAFWNTLWEQAAAQGQSVFVSSGDAGATGCYQNLQYGTAYGVNALGSSDYNVAVGGSMFVDYGPLQYWSTGVPAPAPAGYNFATAKGYIPEAAWNEGYLSTTYLNTASTATQTGAGAIGGGGGISVFTPRPAWQTGSNIPASDPTNCSQKNAAGTCAASGVASQTTGVHRLVPDISSIAASGHAATVVCYEGSCSNNSTGYGIGAVGGTSVAAPVSASVQALINQKNGGRQGNPNFHYYPLANNDYVSGACKSLNGTAGTPTVTLPSTTCNFHDIVTGSNTESQNSTDAVGLGFNSATGYDEASGLGSMNINNVANNWNTVSLAATTTTFTLTPTNTTHGTLQTLSAAVSSTTGTPTGDVDLIAVTTNPGTAQRYTLTSGAYSGSITGLPGGTYNVYVHYAGDGTYAPSDSAAQSVTIAKENSTVTPQVYDFYYNHYQTPAQNTGVVPYSYIDDIIVTPAGTSATGIPTGTVIFGLTNTTTSTTLPSLTVTLDSAGTGALIAGGTYSGLLLAANYAALPAGSYTVTANYSGDNSFNSSTGSSAFTITKVTPTGVLTPSSSYISSGASETLTYTLSRSSNLTSITSLAAYPSGTVTFTDTTSSTVLGTATLNSIGVAVLTSTGIANTGANTITATYSGDNNYSALGTPTSGTVTVGSYTSTSTGLAVTAGTYYVGNSVTLTATVTPAVAASVRFYDGSTYLGAATASASTGIATFSASALTAGSHSLSASFVGTTTYAASTGTATVSVLQNITTTTVETNASVSTGQVVSINGRLTRNPSTTVAPVIALTGTITFYDGATSIGTATPVFQPGGTAYYVGTMSTSTLSRGTHSISAVYSGDANYATSTSAGVVKLTIVPNNIWVANTSGSVSGMTNGGGSVANPSGGGTGIAIDNSGNVWSLNKTSNSVAEFSSTGSVVSTGYTGAGILSPTALAIDGAGMVWVANSNATISVINSAGTAVSPASGYNIGTSTPTSLTIDSSGTIWITNAGNNSVTQTFGGAAPVSTPTATAIVNNTLAAKP